MKDFINIFVYFIIGVKLVYSCLFFYKIYLQRIKVVKDYKKINEFSHYESISELVVIFCLGILLILLFNPYQKEYIHLTSRMKTNLYLLGFVLLFTVRDFWDKLSIAVVNTKLS